MKTSWICRREFLKNAAGTAAAALMCTGPGRLLAASAQKRIPVGLQLYSVRSQCEKDLPATISAVANMGYKGVEFAGYYKRSAKALRKILDDVGLKCCGTHTAIETLLPEKLAETIEFNQILGNKFLIVPGLPEKYTKTRQAWRDTANLFSELAEKVKPHNMRVGYHNHTVEFTALDGEMPWDTFFGRAKKEVVMQFDTGNAMHGSGDPVHFLRRYPGRATTVHIKPFSKSKPNAVLGEDELPWKQIFNLCETIGGTEWYIIEYESDAYPPLVSVEKCLQAMKKWGKI